MCTITFHKIFKFFTFALLLHTSVLSAVVLDTQDTTNGECPEELISDLDKINHQIIIEGEGIMNADWDVDRYRFTPIVAGTVTVTLTSPQPMTIKGGDICNTQNYFRSNNALSHEESFHVDANQLVSLSMFDWDTDNYTYHLKIKFIPDNAPPTLTDTIAPVITLNGSNPMNLHTSDNFVDPGAEANDNLDGNISSSINTTGSVNTSVAGTYILTYTVSDKHGNTAQKRRTVIVTDTTPNPSTDTTKPVITLNGNEIINIQKGNNFTDPGATAIDNNDGDITSTLYINGSVDTTKIGTYVLVYIAKDNACNVSVATRIINVKDDIPNPPPVDQTAPELKLRGDNPINIKVGEIFNDPGAEANDNIDGNITSDIIVNGNVDTTTAGTYTITYTVSDQAGNKASISRTVNIIENTPPPSNETFTESQDSTNGECPAELISSLDHINHQITLQGEGIMNAGWDIDRYRFTPSSAGNIHITLTSPQAMTIKGGNVCNSETYFRSNDALSHDVTFHVEANALVSLSMFDWETDNYTYHLDIEFTPDNAPQPPTPGVVYGLETRPHNSNCYFPTRPGEESGDINDLELTSVTAFPGKSFNNPVGLYQAPNNNDRWYVLELSGRVKTFLQNSGTTTALDISDKTIMQSEQGLLGMAIHPQFPTKPYIYLSYTDLNGNSVVSRFTTHDNGVTFDKGSEKVILQVEQPYENHNGGNIAFGPDGYLYIGYGDGGSGNDPHNNGQNTSTLLATMLRIDVDHGEPYAIPSDNPFAGNPKAVNGKCNSAPCPEIFAWGLRNPWRWSFDKETGKLWVGDVGQNAWEEIDIVEKGKNYGWRCKEATHTTSNSCNNISGVPFTDPIIEYPNTGYNAVTGGYVYRGAAIPALRGVYLYCDYVTGTVKGYLPNHTTKDFIYHGPYIASFAQDNAGEIYMLDVWSGTIKKIVAKSGTTSTKPFPMKLSQTGCFNGTQPSSSLIPYAVNTMLWSDDLGKKRWMALQDGTTIEMDDEKRQWKFPIGTVLIKEFDKGDKKIETRFLIRHNDGGWGAYTYKWNDANTDADLVDVASSLTEDIGGQIWTFPSSAQCFACHTSAANYALGPETVQLNKSIIYPTTGLLANQIDTYNHIGLFHPSLTKPAKQLDKFEDNATTAQKARAYLHSNCSGCHMPGGGTPSSMDLRYFKTLSQTKTCNQTPSSGTLGIEGAKIIKPGDAQHSVLIYRLETLSDSKMPPFGRNVVDTNSVQMLKDWINSLSNCDDH